jgi:hypothetical protein
MRELFHESFLGKVEELNQFSTALFSFHAIFKSSQKASAAFCSSAPSLENTLKLQ